MQFRVIQRPAPRIRTYPSAMNFFASIRFGARVDGGERPEGRKPRQLGTVPRLAPRTQTRWTAYREAPAGLAAALDLEAHRASLDVCADGGMEVSHLRRRAILEEIRILPIDLDELICEPVEVEQRGAFMSASRSSGKCRL